MASSVDRDDLFTKARMYSPLDQLGDQLASVTALEQHVPCLGNIFELGLNNRLRFFVDLQLAVLNRFGEYSYGFLSLVEEVGDDEAADGQSLEDRVHVVCNNLSASSPLGKQDETHSSTP